VQFKAIQGKNSYPKEKSSILNESRITYRTKYGRAHFKVSFGNRALCRGQKQQQQQKQRQRQQQRQEQRQPQKQKP
jgi:hypothetical protein